MMSNEWDDYADDWDKDTSARDYADKASLELKNIVVLKGLRVLDFGCGTGLLSERLSPNVHEIVALDGSTKMIERLSQKLLPNVSSIAEFLTRELIDSNELLAGKFDLIVASSVCSFLPDYEGTLSLLSSLLSPEGIFVQWDWLSPIDESDFGLTIKRVSHALENTGFKKITITQPYVIKSSKGDMPVLMAFGHKAD